MPRGEDEQAKPPSLPPLPSDDIDPPTTQRPPRGDDIDAPTFDKRADTRRAASEAEQLKAKLAANTESAAKGTDAKSDLGRRQKRPAIPAVQASGEHPSVEDPLAGLPKPDPSIGKPNDILDAIAKHAAAEGKRLDVPPRKRWLSPQTTKTLILLWVIAFAVVAAQVWMR